MPSVLVQCTVTTDTADQQPRYRVWVRDEMFTERQWRWTNNECLEEQIGVRGDPGQYPVRIEMVPGWPGDVAVTNWRVVEGPGRVDDQGCLEILNENT